MNCPDGDAINQNVVVNAVDNGFFLDPVTVLDSKRFMMQSENINIKENGNNKKEFTTNNKKEFTLSRRELGLLHYYTRGLVARIDSDVTDWGSSCTGHDTIEHDDFGKDAIIGLFKQIKPLVEANYGTEFEDWKQMTLSASPQTVTPEPLDLAPSSII